MGRKKEHVASKSFTIGLKELAFLGEEADRLKIKQSKLLTKYIRTIMLDHIEKEKLEHGPITWCTTCSEYREFGESSNGRWLCNECSDDKTDVVKHLLVKH